ncbi:MAG: class I SAM-dependent methyltransferase [Phycisphaeraceae bacterium]
MPAASDPTHPLNLYRLAVQAPEAEVQLLLRMYNHHRGGDWPTRLKEDFAGTSALAANWVLQDEDYRALAVDNHGPTVRWASGHAEAVLGERMEDLHLLEADVLEVTRPKVDVVCAFNFSTFVYHDRKSLIRYLRAARKSLRPGGIIVLDAYGGPGAIHTGSQTRHVEPEAGEGPAAFDYVWEQRAFDAMTHRTDCRIHFDLPGQPRIESAFRYDWRLWTLPELAELLREAGFAATAVWCDRYDPEAGTSDGWYGPVEHLPAREDWLAYVVGLR